MHRASADLSTGTTPARGVGPCRACQVGEERAALQPARAIESRGRGVTARRKTARMAYRAGRSVKICLWRFFFPPLPLFFPYEPLDFSPFSRRAQTPFVRYSFCLSFHSCASNSSFRFFVLFCSSPAVAVLGGRAAAAARYFVLACVIVFGRRGPLG